MAKRKEEKEKEKVEKKEAKKEKKNKKENKSLFFIILSIVVFLALGASGFLIYELFLLSSIETTLRYIVIGVLALIDILLLIKLILLKKGKRKKKKKPVGFTIFTILYTIACFSIGFVINYLYSKVDNINKDLVTYSSSLLTMAKDPATKISDINDYEIGILDDEKSPDGYIIPQEIIKEYKLNDTNIITPYDNYSSMLVDMYAGELDAMFISSSYADMYSGITGYEDITTDTKVIISKDKEMKKTETSSIETASVNKSVTEPFTILLMGIDSTDEVLSKNAVANGDTLILITFNPKTLNATMISIPRDSYVPIACWPNRDENKITHAAGYGNDCMINTIQNYFGITIDYYAKINFKGLVKLVDAVGGVEVDVPQQLCTDDSSRGGTICINPGRQTLNGEQALVFARNRKSLVNGDFGRAQHQQEIIMALIDKMKTITKVSQFTQILDTISNSLDTNLTTKQILEFYNVGKDIIKKSLSSEEAELINIQQLYLYGNSQMIYDERMRMVLYNYVPNNNSKKDVVQAMKENLELVEHKEIKSFNFSVNNPYEKVIIGEGPYRSGSGTYSLLPSFIGLTEDAAAGRAAGLGLSVKFVGDGGTVIDQSYPASKRIDKIKDTLVLTLSSSVIEDDDDKAKDEDEEQDQDEDDEVPDKDNDDENDDNETGSGTTPTPSPSPSPSPSTSPSPSSSPTPGGNENDTEDAQ